MHYRFAKHQASQRKGRQLPLPFGQPGGRGRGAGRNHTACTPGTRASFFICNQGHVPSSPSPRNTAVRRAPFTGPIAERRENYLEIMVLIMGHSRHLADESGDAWLVCPLAPWWVPTLLPHPDCPQGSHASSLNGGTFRLLGKSIFSLHFILTFFPSLIQESKQESSSVQSLQRRGVVVRFQEVGQWELDSGNPRMCELVPAPAADSALRVWGKARAPGDPFIVCTSGAEVQPSEGCHSIPHSQEGTALGS